MKKIIAGLMIVNTLVCGMILGKGMTKEKNIEVTRITTQSEEGLYLEEGQEYIEFSDGSWAICGNGEYIFQPVDLGDWSYEVENEQQLEKIIRTYISMKNEGMY